MGISRSRAVAAARKKQRKEALNCIIAPLLWLAGKPKKKKKSRKKKLF